MLKSFIQRRERHLAYLNDNRVVRPFAWGDEFIDSDFLSVDQNSAPTNLLSNYSQNAIARSDEFFAFNVSDFQISESNLVTWQSQLSTASPENNHVRAQFFETKNKSRRRAVIVLPHWNSPPNSYFALCRMLNRVGIAALRLSLPYHDARMPSELERADYLVSSNIGLTLQSVRQAVLDTRSAVQFLKQQGFERVGIVGTSIGSCVAFLALIHDPQIDAAVFNHVSGYFSDVVWHGISTYHVKQALETEISLEQLREFWLPISPMAYLDKLKNQPSRPLRFIYTLYDLTFPVELSRAMMREFERHSIAHDKTVIPCGHYTLGEVPFVYLDGWKIINYLRTKL